MDPYLKQRLRDEVIYLHSLWHRGPPRNPNPHHNASRHLQPSNPTQFKKEKTRIRPRGKKGKKRLPQSDPPPVSDVEWPVEKAAETPSLSASGWPILKLPPPRATRLPSAEEQARFAATQAQQKALKAAQEYFAGNVDSDGDEDDGSDEDDLMDEDGDEENQFFSNVFMEDAELRAYYEKNWEGGDFCCLVCCGIGKKVGKRFKDCVALVQHSITIAKTKKKRAHRAYAQIMCKVLGWDIDRLPTIVRPLAKPIDCLGNAEVGIRDSSVLNKDSNLENVNNGELKGVSDVGQEEELHNSSVPGTSNVNCDNAMLCENSLEVGDGNKRVGNIDNAVLSVVDGNTEGVVNHLERSKEVGFGNKIKNNQKGILVVNDLKENTGNPN